MKRTRKSRFILATSAAALALGVAACEVDDAGGDGMEDPGVEDDGAGDDL